MKNYNKKGQMGIVVGIILVLLVIGGFYLVVNQSGQSVIGGLGGDTSCADSTGILTVSDVNALQKGTAIASPTLTAVLDNGVQKTITSGTTTLAVGQKFDLLVSKTDYIDTVVRGLQMSCGGLEVQAEQYQATSDNPKITIKDLDTSTTALTNNVAGGAVNVSNVASGDVINLDVEFQGTALESSGDGIYVVELPAGSNANVTSGDSGVSLGNLNHVSIPTVYASNNAGSRVDAFYVPAIVGSDSSKYTLLVSLQASKDLAGGVYTTWYAQQNFLDTDGTIQFGVEDSQGTAKYENTESYNFYINSA